MKAATLFAGLHAPTIAMPAHAVDSSTYDHIWAAIGQAEQK
jgi:hypothetical protein